MPTGLSTHEFSRRMTEKRGKIEANKEGTQRKPTKTSPAKTGLPDTNCETRVALDTF